MGIKRHSAEEKKQIVKEALGTRNSSLIGRKYNNSIAARKVGDSFHKKQLLFQHIITTFRQLLYF